MDPSSVPDFDNLPKVDGQPQGCAWGVFDKDGKKDVLGTLNFLTPPIVAAAASEVKDGVSISLNWPLNGIKFPFPFRKAPVHRAATLREAGMDMDGWDDELEINTQFSSQWDSLCHVTHKSGCTYNGHKPTKEGLECQSTADNMLPTIDRWHNRGCVVGRGVLIDFKTYIEETTGAAFDALDGHRITVEEIEKVAKFQGVEFKHGDILIVRTGYTEILEAPTDDMFAKFSKSTLAGVHGTVDTARWIWNKRFAAVAGDAHAFEAIPPAAPDGTAGLDNELVLHNYFLTMFGLPIGELWDLKELGAYAKKTGRYSFMLTSAPLNHPGLVASPPNAVAIF
ncbi:putative cyclase-domain-containing protein [Apodospora peruviana]|uniref:Cyclase-domain-containing protein n=1 Tax=Apodospora peruviana TaxID=516989 RepID=A0AAE0IJ68_9PEZI|nr:putative cyclase-domain-containing protein [Apodospora peruviana]